MDTSKSFEQTLSELSTISRVLNDLVEKQRSDVKPLHDEYMSIYNMRRELEQQAQTLHAKELELHRKLYAPFRRQQHMALLLEEARAGKKNATREDLFAAIDNHALRLVLPSGNPLEGVTAKDVLTTLLEDNPAFPISVAILGWELRSHYVAYTVQGQPQSEIRCRFLYNACTDDTCLFCNGEAILSLEALPPVFPESLVVAELGA